MLELCHVVKSVCIISAKKSYVFFTSLAYTPVFSLNICSVMHMIYQASKKTLRLTACCVYAESTSVTKSKGNRVFCVRLCRRKVEKYKVACAREASQHHLCVRLSATLLLSPLLHTHTHPNIQNS